MQRQNEHQIINNEEIQESKTQTQHSNSNKEKCKGNKCRKERR